MREPIPNLTLSNVVRSAVPALAKTLAAAGADARIVNDQGTLDATLLKAFAGSQADIQALGLTLGTDTLGADRIVEGLKKAGVKEVDDVREVRSLGLEMVRLPE